MIILEEICYRYPRQRESALRSVSLKIEPGSFFALLGPNGAGKTTLMRLLCGRLRPESGRWFLPPDWYDTQGRPDLRRYGVLIENPGIYPKLSVEEYLNFFASFYAQPGIAERRKEVLRRLQFSDTHRPMGKLSLGERQKVQIARTLQHRPDLLILDEPASHLDPASRESLWDLLKSWRRQEGTTILVSSHVLEEVEHHCSHVGIIGGGRILASGDMESIRSENRSSRFVMRVARPLDDAERIFVNNALVCAGGTDIQEIGADAWSYATTCPEQVNPQVVSRLTDGDILLVELRLERTSLQEVYVRLLGEVGL